MTYKKPTKGWVRIKIKDGGFFGSSEFRYEKVKVLGRRSEYNSYYGRSCGYYLVKDTANHVFEVVDDDLFRGDIE